MIDNKKYKNKLEKVLTIISGHGIIISTNNKALK